MLWIQVIGLPLAIAGLIYAGLAYSHQADDAQRALAAIRVQQREVIEQQQTIHTMQASISAQIQQLQAARLSAKAQEDLLAGVRQLTLTERRLAELLARGGAP